MSSIVFDWVKDKHIAGDEPTRSFYNLYWMLVKLGCVPYIGHVQWTKDINGRIGLSRFYIREIEAKLGQ
jgi:hypothetical protein